MGPLRAGMDRKANRPDRQILVGWLVSRAVARLGKISMPTSTRSVYTKLRGSLLTADSDDAFPVLHHGFARFVLRSSERRRA